MRQVLAAIGLCLLLASAPAQAASTPDPAGAPGAGSSPPATATVVKLPAQNVITIDAGTGRVIPVALSGHRLGPVASGERGDPVGHSHELVPAVTTCVDDRLVAVPDAVAEIIAAHEFPDVFHRI